MLTTQLTYSGLIDCDQNIVRYQLINRVWLANNRYEFVVRSQQCHNPGGPGSQAHPLHVVSSPLIHHYILTAPCVQCMFDCIVMIVTYPTTVLHSSLSSLLTAASHDQPRVTTDLLLIAIFEGITWNERHLPEINSGAFNNYFYAPAI